MIFKKLNINHEKEREKLLSLKIYQKKADYNIVVDNKTKENLEHA